MSLKLDAFDQKIIELLLSNAKESITAIGRKIKLGRENVDYKLKRLIKQGLIKDFVTEFDEQALRIKHHVLFAQLDHLTGNTENQILAYLKEHRYISWIGTAAGKWTLICDLYVPEHLAVNLVLDKILIKCGAHFGDYAILELIQGEYFFEKYVERKASIMPRKMVKESTKKLDGIDYQIMALLNSNARINYAELSSKIGLTANGIKKRIKDLEKTKIIKKYSLTLDFKKFSYEWYGIQLKLTQFDLDTVNRIQQFFRNHPQVIFYYKYIGPWDYDLGFIARNSAELREFINELRTKFPEELKLIDVFITLDEIKGYQLPDGVFQQPNEEI